MRSTNLKSLQSILLFVLALIAIDATAQSATQPIQLLGQPKKDRIWLRWAPTSSAYWTLGNKYGYVVERFALTNTGDLENPAGTKLTPTPLKPATAQEFERLSATAPEASVLQELLYNKEPVAVKKSTLTRASDADNEFGMALLVCDLSQPVAKAAGLFFEDATAQPGRSYIYKVSIAFTPKSGALQPAVVVVQFTDEMKLTANKEFKVQFGDRLATLSWPTLFDRGIYTAYYIERSIDNGAFKRVSDLPYVHMTTGIDNGVAFYADSLINNVSKYSYKIQGVTPFGELGPFSASLSGNGRDDLSGFLVLREGIVNEQNAKLTWEFPAELEKQISGFQILEAPAGDGPYNVTGTKAVPSQRTVDVKVSNGNSYFVIRAVDAQGNEITRSFPYLVHIEDNTPPAIPVGLKGTVSSKGTASLQWQANKDADILGYRVFRSNSRNDEAVEVTKDILPAPVFIDSLETKTLNRDVFYRVIAVDQRFNTSGYSEILKVSKPDVIAPIAPVFGKVELRRDTIALSWINSASTDIQSTTLRRRNKLDTTSLALKTWRSELPRETWDDTGLALGQTYYYEIVVIDSAGNRASSRSGEVFFETGVRAAITNLSAKADRDKKHIVVKWKNSSTPVKGIVFRSVNGGAFSIYKTIEGSPEEIVDSTISIGNTYAYKVQMVYKGGIRSTLPKEASVKY